MKQIQRPGQVAVDDDTVPVDGPAAGKKTLTAMLPPSSGGADPSAHPELAALAPGHGPAPGNGGGGGNRAHNGHGGAVAHDAPIPHRPTAAPAPPRRAARGEGPAAPAPVAPVPVQDDPFALHTAAGAAAPGRTAKPAPPRPAKPAKGGPTESEPEPDGD